MKKSWIVIIVVVLVVLVFYGWIKNTYNSFVTKSQAVNAQWSQVENVYQRRADLIPNLVNTVKGYATHEKETLEGVVEARAKATSVTIDANHLTPQALQNFQAAQSGLSQALSRLMVVVERYPDLKANTNFMQLQGRITELEEKIAAQRSRYNEDVNVFNIRIAQIPANIVAGFMHLEPHALFQVAEADREDVKVSFA